MSELSPLFFTNLAWSLVTPLACLFLLPFVAFSYSCVFLLPGTFPVCVAFKFLAAFSPQSCDV